MSGFWFTVLGGVAMVYAGAAALMYGLQRRLIYPRAALGAAPPAADLPGVRAERIAGHDGLELTHWYSPPTDAREAAGAVVVAFHGNAGTAADRAAKLRALAGAGYGLLLVEYRGYAGNPGAPSEAGLIADGAAVVDWLQARGVAPGRIVLYGESLGTGVAVGVAARRQVGAVVLDAPFTSLAAVAQAHYWYLPAYPLVRDRFDSARRIGRIDAPLLILHGAKDAVVPPRLGRRLFACAKAPKEMRTFADGGHVDLFDHGADRTTLAFLDRWLNEAAVQASAV